MRLKDARSGVNSKDRLPMTADTEAPDAEIAATAGISTDALRFAERQSVST
jgi:hypothetical protein